MKSHWRIVLLTIGIVCIIFGAPWLFTLPNFHERFSYEGTGSIGDTIGGLTAPFINGLGAILVYIAFHEQVRANKLLSTREQARDILDQIKSIKENQNEEHKFENTVGEIIDQADRMTMPTRDQTLSILLDRALHFLSEFSLAKELLERYDGDQTFLRKKVKFLYTIKYYEYIRKLYTSLTARHGLEGNNHVGVIAEIVSTINELDNYFNPITDEVNIDKPAKHFTSSY